MRSHSRYCPVFLASAVCILLARSHDASAVSIELVTVGDPGNIGNPYFGGKVGSVDHVFAMGKYEITAGQYTEFLNAVAATDTFYLYSTYMDTSNDAWGCGITRSGSPGSYTYNVAADLANRPVNRVSWGDAARFANWLSNGQPTGSQIAATTEDGSYPLHGASYAARKPDARFVIPNWSEWNKAAYYDPAKPGDRAIGISPPGAILRATTCPCWAQQTRISGTD